MNPSLLLIPDRYKASKLYSQIPDTGAGDLSFTRALDTATRVNSAGLIEKVRTNLLLRSQEFTNAAWTKEGITLTGSQTDPNGGTNAFLATATATSSSYFYQTTSTASCVSIFAKAGTRSKFSIINGLFAQGAEFDLAAQTTIVSNAGSLAKIEAVGDGWFRCSVFLSSVTEAIIALDEVFGGGVTIGQTMSFAFAQQETGDIATPYIPTTTAAVSVGMTANIPRIDYTGGGCGKLLLEPQRTNLVTFSEQINDVSYTKQDVTISANAGISPDGTTSADLVFPTTTGTNRLVEKLVGISFIEPQTISYYLKASGINFVALDQVDGGIGAWFNLSLGTIGTISVGVSASIESAGNGWYRCSIARLSGGGATAFNRIRLVDGNNLTSVTKDGTNGVLIWGVQNEQGAYPTSYIPTLGASVTRSADAASKTGISALIGQTEGTLFVEVNVSILQGAVARTFIDIGATNNRIFLGFTSSASNTIRLQIDTALGVARVDFRGVVTSNGTLKVAAAYKDGDCALFINGVAGTQLANNSISFSTISNVFLGQTISSTAILGDGTNTAALYTTRLSNSELATLTSL